jgi:preprotein translocase subunit SecY
MRFLSTLCHDCLFAFFYTAIVFSIRRDTADNLKKHGGFIPASGRQHL